MDLTSFKNRKIIKATIALSLQIFLEHCSNMSDFELPGMDLEQPVPFSSISIPEKVENKMQNSI